MSTDVVASTSGEWAVRTYTAAERPQPCDLCGQVPPLTRRMWIHTATGHVVCRLCRFPTFPPGADQAVAEKLQQLDAPDIPGQTTIEDHI